MVPPPACPWPICTCSLHPRLHSNSPHPTRDHKRPCILLEEELLLLLGGGLEEEEEQQQLLLGEWEEEEELLLQLLLVVQLLLGEALEQEGVLEETI